MTVNAKQVTSLDYAEAISEGLGWCLECERPPSETLSDDHLELLTPAGFRELALYGWISAVNNRFHTERQSVCRPRPAAHPVEGRNPFGSWEPLDMWHQGAGEAMKRLAAFDLGDLKSLCTAALGQENGWRVRRQWAEVAMEMIGMHKRATRIEQLPTSQVEELSQLAKAAWS